MFHILKEYWSEENFGKRCLNNFYTAKYFYRKTNIDILIIDFGSMIKNLLIINIRCSLLIHIGYIYIYIGYNIFDN